MKRSTRTNWLDGFAVGPLSATLSFTLLFWMLDGFGEISAVFHGYIVAFVTMVGTLVAALIAVRGVSLQIGHVAEQEEDRHQRALRAPIAMMPLALSDFVQVCEANIRRHFSAVDLYPSPLPYPTAFSHLSAETLNILRECVQHVDELTYHEMLYLFRAYQILLAREPDQARGRLIVAHQDERSMTDHARMDNVIQWVVLHAVASNIFGYSRGEVQTVPKFDFAEPFRKLSICGVELDSFPNLKALADQRRKEGALGFSFHRRR